jgi:hypothetical protein
MSSPTPRKDFSIRITVVGHASSRYLGAANRADADARNKLLSEQRAETVRKIVEYNVNMRLHGVKIEPRTAGVPRGFQLEATGVGNTQPHVKEPDNGDAPANRVAIVTLELLTADSVTVRKPRPLRVDARTTAWTVQVLQLRGSAVGVSVGQIRIALRNLVSNKEVRAYADLIGGGTPSVGDTVFKAIKREPVSNPIPFATNKPMGFTDFKGVYIRLDELNASVALPVIGPFGPGYGATYRRLSFVGLGSGAEGLVFDTSHGARWSNDLAASVTSGRLQLEGSIPSDWIELGTTYDSVPVPVGDYQKEGLTVGFPTGKTGEADLSRDDKEKLEDFVALWAAEVNKLFSKGFALTTP